MKLGPTLSRQCTVSGLRKARDHFPVAAPVISTGLSACWLGGGVVGWEKRGREVA